MEVRVKKSDQLAIMITKTTSQISIFCRYRIMTILEYFLNHNFQFSYIHIPTDVHSFLVILLLYFRVE